MVFSAPLAGCRKLGSESCTDGQDGSDLKSVQEGVVLFSYWATPDQKLGEAVGVNQSEHLTTDTLSPPIFYLLFFS